jgi:hypothetical protein
MTGDVGGGRRRRGLPIGISREATYGNRFRAARMASFLRLVDAVLVRQDVCRIIDVGGEANYWLGLEDIWAGRNLDITLVNLTAPDERDPRFTYAIGDARHLDQFGVNSFDIVHSNSVIEHLRTWADQRTMADEVRRLAPAYFVQTPNYWFPYEPHLRMPFIHWLPLPWQMRIVLARACGFYKRARDVNEAREILADATLLTVPQMAFLFPDAEITTERFCYLTKSIMASRSADLRQ